MSTSMLYHAQNIKGCKYKSFRRIKGGIVYKASQLAGNLACPRCRCKNAHFKGQKLRRFKMVPIGRKKCYLDVVLHRLECSRCCHKWWPRLPFMQGKFRMTKAFMQYAFDLLSIMTIKDATKVLGVSWNVAKLLHKMKLTKLYKKISIKNVRYISMDEFAIRKGHTYMTVFTDIESGRIIFAVEGRRKEDIEPFLQELKKKAKNLQAIAMDMSTSYIPAVQETLPGIDIVFDHFHVNAIMNKALDEIRKEEQAKLNEEEKKVLKGNRFLFLSNYENLIEEKKGKLEAILQINAPLFKAHCLKEQFRGFWDLSSREEAEKFLDQWSFDAVSSGVKKLSKLANTLRRHWTGLLNYFKHRITNAAAEGINNKIKTMKRQAYGFRDMEYFKLRLYHLHNQRYSFVG